MESVVSLVLFTSLAIMMLLLSVLAITTRSLLRSAVYLLLVLIGTAGLYLFMNYHFLAAVQISIYAGGVLILFIFAIFLTTNKKSILPQGSRIRKYIYAGLTCIAGIIATLFILLQHQFLYRENNMTMIGDESIPMTIIGKTLMGTEKYQYLMPFEVLSVLLLACIIGGILIARKK